MAIFLVSYDLNQHDRDYPRVSKILEGMGAVRCLYSQWLVRSNGTALGLANRIEGALDSNDALLVVQVESSSAWANLMNQTKSVALLEEGAG